MLPDHSVLSEFRTSLQWDILGYLPELILVSGIVGLLLLQIVTSPRRIIVTTVSVIVLALALAVLLGIAASGWSTHLPGSFSGLLQLDPLANFFRVLLVLFGGWLVVLTYWSGFPDAEDAADFYVLLLGGTVGLMLMVSAQHLLLVFLGLEMASLPSYMLSGFRRSSRVASEAALKYAIYGAASAGMALYGISLLTVAAGSGDLSRVAAVILDSRGPSFPIAAAGGLLFLVGLGFKLAAVPFHFWLPDVFTGATAEVAAFLAVASKAAAVGLGARLIVLLWGLASAEGETVMVLPSLFVLSLILAAAVTTTVGNLAALTQTELQRLFGYSTIAHSGIMLMGLATMRPEGLIAVLVYLVGYFPMNLGVFATIACLRNGTEPVPLQVEDCQGLAWQRPAMGVPFVVFVMSLLGLPPLAGFVGKFLIFISLYQSSTAAFATGAVALGWGYGVLLAIGLVNTLISAGYYLRLARAVGLDAPGEKIREGVLAAESGLAAQPMPAGLAVYFVLLALALLMLGLMWAPVLELATRVVAETSSSSSPF
jgi:NADH-quinone oxidoreductase subunit N